MGIQDGTLTQGLLLPLKQPLLYHVAIKERILTVAFWAVT